MIMHLRVVFVPLVDSNIMCKKKRQGLCVCVYALSYLDVGGLYRIYESGRGHKARGEGIHLPSLSKLDNSGGYHKGTETDFLGGDLQNQWGGTGVVEEGCCLVLVVLVVSYCGLFMLFKASEPHVALFSLER